MSPFCLYYNNKKKGGVMQAVILCGGKGTRLKSVINDIPKPMAQIADKPFLAYLIDLLQSNGFDKILLLTGYKSEIIENYFASQPEISFEKESSLL